MVIMLVVVVASVTAVLSFDKRSEGTEREYPTYDRVIDDDLCRVLDLIRRTVNHVLMKVYSAASSAGYAELQQHRVTWSAGCTD